MSDETKFRIVTDTGGGTAFTKREKRKEVGLDEAQAGAKRDEMNARAEDLGIETRYVLEPVN